jgi:hypothetical protein
MPNFISKLAENISISESPWQFKLMAMLVIIFFSGGLLLDYLASTVVIQGLSGAAEHAELDKLMLEFTKKKHESLTASASLLYDFSKIALGALIASVTQVLKIAEKSKKTGEEEV